MWIEGWDRTGLTIHYTFSEMLAMNSYVQGVYIAWCAVYTVVTGVLITLCLLYYWKDGKTDTEGVPKNWCCSTERYKILYVAFSVFYVFLSVIKVGCIWAIAWVDTNNYPTAHAIVAGFAFGSAILCSILLFLRRVVLSKFIEKPHLTWVFYLVNFLWCGTLLGLGITLVIVRTGEYEFTVMLMIILDPLFQIYDFYWEPNFEHRYFNEKKHTKLNLSLKPKKGFFEKLFRKKHIY